MGIDLHIRVSYSCQILIIHEYHSAMSVECAKGKEKEIYIDKIDQNDKQLEQ